VQLILILLELNLFKENKNYIVLVKIKVIVFHLLQQWLVINCTIVPLHTLHTCIGMHVYEISVSNFDSLIYKLAIETTI